MKEDKTTINLEIDILTKDSLKKEASEKEMSLSGLIRLILKNYVNGKKKAI